jgi:hypothetical protein
MSNKIPSLKAAMEKEFSNANVYRGGVEAATIAAETLSSVSNESMDIDKKNKKEVMIKRPIKSGVVDKLVGKTKMKTPIGKLTMGLPIMGEDKSGKKQFQKDIQTDTDFKKFKEKDNEFGTPNVTVSDPFIKKNRYKRVGKEESKESTGSGSAGGFSAPLFSTTKGEMEEECWKGYKQIGGKKKNGKMVPNCVKENKEEYCDSCDRVKSKCVCGETKKVEATEATGSGSSGSYETNAAWAKSTSKKDWRGKSKTQIPGGKFVQVKKKCKKFPYCNQGDIKALKIFENENVKNAIKNISERHNISENVIKSIIAYEYENTFPKK